MKSFEIRQAFLDYFARNGHKVIESSPVFPADDPTLLFTNAGMVQFKNTFLGLEKRDYGRATTSQKCIRAGGKHNDLDQVGFTARHQTFFEMLGNFSFGDYFKEEAISFAWEFVTKTLDLDPKRLYATVYNDDDDAERLWKKIAPELGDRIRRFGEKDNFWSMGETGPCGPCSEIHYDRGPEIPGELNGEGDRFMEIWNLVFMQYNRDDKGILTPLPKPSVDTGAGLERFCMVMQHVDSNYGTDLFVPLIAKVSELSGKPYKLGPEGVAHKVIADHVRALSFAIADNAIISNEGRGYVLRRILRRAARYGHELGLNEPFLYKIVPTLVEKMGGVYPELKAHRGKIELVIKSEEEQFDRTLENGIGRFSDIVGKLLAGGGKIVAGAEVFRLYDTYGFPADLTEIMAKEKGLAIDWAGFEKELEQQRERSRISGRFDGFLAVGIAKKARKPGLDKFLYDTTTLSTSILGYKEDAGKFQFVLEQTPFYAESGGQIGDTGFLFSNQFKIKVNDTKSLNSEHVHFGEIIWGEYPDGYLGSVTAQLDEARRADIQRNHTATHLLHKALRMVLGEHVYQSGSLVDDKRLRFDFSHFKAMTTQELDKAEKIVAEKIAEDLSVSWENKSMDEAKQMGATALFGEKYGDTVRVVKSGDFSMELCGGTHVTHTADIGRFFIVSESAIAAGVRRIEAITGREAENFFVSQKEKIDRLNSYLGLPPEKLDAKAVTEVKTLKADIHPRLLIRDDLVLQLEQLLDTVNKLEKEKAKSDIQAIQLQANTIEPVHQTQTNSGLLLVYLVNNSTPNEFMAYFDSLKAGNTRNTIVVISKASGQMAINSPDYDLATKIKDNLVQSVGAKGGGKPSIRGSLPVANVDKAIAGLKENFPV